jgi:hypothetical protein
MAWKPKFAEITAKTHTQQAVWWLNGFWADGASEYAETLWNQVLLMIEAETGQKKLYGKRAQEVKEGCDLDELKSHIFLEKQGETLTVRALRARLKELDIDNNKRMCLSEYLLAKHKKTPQQLIIAPQGDADAAKLQAAQDQLNRAQDQLSDVQDALEKQKQAEKKVKQAEAELQAAIKELEALETAYKSKCAELEAIGNSDAGAVKKNKAKNELAQLQGEDPLPLRKAKLTQGAALKRVEKERVAMEVATAAVAEEVAKAKAAVAEAVLTIEAIKKAGGGVAHGAVWWMEREIVEMRKFMPK